MSAVWWKVNGEDDIMLSAGSGRDLPKSRPIREEDAFGLRTGERVGGLRLMPRHPPRSGDYLIGGRKVGGNWGVGGVRLGTQTPSIHLERGDKKVTSSQSAGGGGEVVEALPRCCCARERRRLTHFLPRLSHLTAPTLIFYTSAARFTCVELPGSKISLHSFTPPPVLTY